MAFVLEFFSLHEATLRADWRLRRASNDIGGTVVAVGRGPCLLIALHGGTDTIPARRKTRRDTVTSNINRLQREHTSQRSDRLTMMLRDVGEAGRGVCLRSSEHARDLAVLPRR